MRFPPTRFSSLFFDSIRIALTQHEAIGPAPKVRDYQAEHVSWKVAKIIMGYTDYVRRNVWKEHTP